MSGPYRDIPKILESFTSAQSWRELLSLAPGHMQRMSLYPVMLACVLRDAGGLVVVSDETLRTILREMKEAKFAASFAVALEENGILLSDGSQKPKPPASS